jgi:hypothetical protein
MGQKEDLDKLQEDIERLKFEYDQYFQGFSKLPPEALRKEVQRTVNRFVGFQSPNTGLKYRAQNLVQRFTTYKQLWDRILRQIEDGTYKRDLYRANLKQKHPQQKGGATAAADDIIEDAELYEEAAPKRKWDSVFDQYAKARSQTQEGSVSYDKLAAVLEKQAAQLREKYQAKDVEFKVVVEAGKTKLKAVPKK